MTSITLESQVQFVTDSAQFRASRAVVQASIHNHRTFQKYSQLWEAKAGWTAQLHRAERTKFPTLMPPMNEGLEVCVNERQQPTYAGSDDDRGSGRVRSQRPGIRVQFSDDDDDGGMPPLNSFRLLAIGPRSAVVSNIKTLHRLGYAQVNSWSPLQEGPNPGEVMSIMTRKKAYIKLPRRVRN
jgi:hypothetical protein